MLRAAYNEMLLYLSRNRTSRIHFPTPYTALQAPRSKMDPVHQHPAIDIFLMKRKRQKALSSGVSPKGAPEKCAAAAGTVHVDTSMLCDDFGASASAGAVVDPAGVSKDKSATAAADGVVESEQCSSTARSSEDDDRNECTSTPEQSQSPTEDRAKSVMNQEEVGSGDNSVDARCPGSAASAWETRRRGAEAARLLRDVKLC